MAAINITQVLPYDQPQENELAHSGPLYKYCMHDHAESLLTAGSIKIGTLYDFRNTYKYDDWIGDIQEGMETEETSDPLFMEKAFPMISFKGNINLNKSIADFAAIKSCPDHYIYCTTKEPDYSIIKSPDNDYDTCIKITNPNLFFLAITAHLDDLGILHSPHFQCKPVEYCQKVHARQQPGPIRSSKLWHLKCDKARYVEQREVRTRWTPKHGNYAGPRGLPSLPLLVIPEVSQYCEIMNF